MPRDSRVYLEDIFTAADRIAAYVSGYTRETFGQDTGFVQKVKGLIERD